MADSDRQWTIGELAQAAGITVRTLHHYDRLGLLVPSERSTGRHRRYTAGDVQRLYRILTLRSLGFALADIATALDADQGSLLEATRAQLAQVERQLAAEERLRDRLTQILTLIESSAEPSTDQLVDAMETMTMTIKLTKIYTRQGDSGETRLGDRTAVPKSHPLVEAGGDIDELNANVGAVLATRELPDEYADWLHRIQNDLFDIGADLSTPADAPAKRRLRLTEEYVL